MISGLVILAALPLLYFGYCRGWWGRQSLLLQYLFQCNCPVTSEEARYPESIDVIVSACRNAGARVAPGGRWLHVDEEWNNVRSSYLLNVETGEKIPTAVPQSNMYFLTDDLVFVSLGSGDGNEYVQDRTTEKQYILRRFRSLYPDALVDGNADPGVLAEALHNASFVFLIDDRDIVVAYTPEFPASAKLNFTTNWLDLPGGEPDKVRLFLQEFDIAYRLIPSGFMEEAVSPDGRFVARRDGIYLSDTGEKVAEGYFIRKFPGKQYFSVRGWTYDSSGVIYSKFAEPCLLETPGIDEPGCLWEVPQPVIKLNVPEEYMSVNEIQ